MSDITVEVVQVPAIEVTVSPAGVPGMSAYQHAVADGFEGTVEEWLASLGGGGGAVDSVAGKTGVVTLEKADVGLGSVDNTSDADKPVSTAQATALAGKASTAHTHAESDVTGLTAALAGKASTSHTHAEGDVTGLTAALAGKLDTSAAPELIRDTVGAALVQGTGITITVSDGGDTITVDAIGGGGSDADTAGYVADDASATRAAADPLWGFQRADNPGAGTAVEGTVDTGGTVSGSTYSSVQWTISVADAFRLITLELERANSGTHTLHIDGVLVDTVVGAGVIAFDVDQDLATGTRTFVVASTVASSLRYAAVGTVRTGSFYGFTEGAWAGFPSFTPRARYTVSAGPVETWSLGDRVWNQTPTAGGYIGWVCVTAGTPGTWKGFGVIQS